MTVDTRVPRFCVGPRLVAILLNTYGEKFFSPSAITTVSWPTPDPSIALGSAPVYNDSVVLARAIRIHVASNPLSLPVYARVRGRDLNLNFARWVGQLNSN